MHHSCCIYSLCFVCIEVKITNYLGSEFIRIHACEILQIHGSIFEKEV